jgi:hypothetical protein
LATSGEAVSDANELKVKLGGSSDVLGKRNVVSDSVLTAFSAMFI